MYAHEFFHFLYLVDFGWFLHVVWCLGVCHLWLGLTTGHFMWRKKCNTRNAFSVSYQAKMLFFGLWQSIFLWAIHFLKKKRTIKTINEWVIFKLKKQKVLMILKKNVFILFALFAYGFWESQRFSFPSCNVTNMQISNCSSWNNRVNRKSGTGYSIRTLAQYYIRVCSVLNPACVCLCSLLTATHS